MPPAGWRSSPRRASPSSRYRRSRPYRRPGPNACSPCCTAPSAGTTGTQTCCPTFLPTRSFPSRRIESARRTTSCKQGTATASSITRPSWLLLSGNARATVLGIEPRPPALYDRVLTPAIARHPQRVAPRSCSSLELHRRCSKAPFGNSTERFPGRGCVCHPRRRPTDRDARAGGHEGGSASAQDRQRRRRSIPQRRPACTTAALKTTCAPGGTRGRSSAVRTSSTCAMSTAPGSTSTCTSVPARGAIALQPGQAVQCRHSEAAGASAARMRPRGLGPALHTP